MQLAVPRQRLALPETFEAVYIKAKKECPVCKTKTENVQFDRETCTIFPHLVEGTENEICPGPDEPVEHQPQTAER